MRVYKKLQSTTGKQHIILEDFKSFDKVMVITKKFYDHRKIYESWGKFLCGKRWVTVHIIVLGEYKKLVEDVPEEEVSNI